LKYLQDISVNSFMNPVRRCLLHAVMVFVILPCGPCGTWCLWRPPRAPHPLLNLDSSEIPRLGRVKEKRWEKIRSAAPLTCPKLHMPHIITH